MREPLCAYCARTERTFLLDEWDTRRNAPLPLKEVSHGSEKRVWWCDKSRVWQASVYMRTSNAAGCPVCAGLVCGKWKLRYDRIMAELER